MSSFLGIGLPFKLVDCRIPSPKVACSNPRNVFRAHNWTFVTVPPPPVFHPAVHFWVFHQILALLCPPNARLTDLINWGLEGLNALETQPFSALRGTFSTVVVGFRALERAIVLVALPIPRWMLVAHSPHPYYSRCNRVVKCINAAEGVLTALDIG